MCQLKRQNYFKKRQCCQISRRRSYKTIDEKADSLKDSSIIATEIGMTGLN